MKKLVSLLLAVIMVISAFVVMPVSAGAADTNTVYLINSANWSDVHAYAWNNSVFGENAPWPGQAMQSAGTHSSGAQMYSITFPSAYENIIFNGSGNQTKDLSYQGGMGYDNGSGQWVAVDGPNPGPTPGPTPTPTPGGQMTVYFQNNWMWTDVKVYYWGSSSTNSSEWPGDTPQLAGNDGVYDVYSVTVPTDVVGVIFNGFDGGNGGNNQTPDIKGAADGDCYSMLWNESQGANDIKKDHISNVLPNIGPVTPTDPVPTEPVPTEPVPTEPVPTQPVPTQPVPTEPVPTQPVPTQPVPTEPVEDIDPNKAYVLVDGNYYEVTKGQTFTYNYTISVNSAKKIGSLDARTEYDEAGLKFVPEVDEYGDIDTTNTFPKLSNVVSNLESGSPLLYNYSNTTGVRMGADTVIFSGKFEVTASKGVFEISSKMKTLADADLNNLVYDFETVGQFSDAEVLPGLTPYNPSNPVNPTTPVPTQPVVDPTTPVPTQPVVADKVYVKVDGVQYEVKKGDVFTYVFNFACSEKVSAMDVETLYNGDGLQFVPTVDSYGDDNLKAMFPVLQNVVYNFNLEDKLIYNYSSVSSVRFPVSANGAYTDSNKVFVGKFKVTADSGVYEISSRIKVLGDGNAEKIIMNYEQINTSVTISQKNEIVGGTVVDPTTPVPTQPVVNPTTPTPTQPVVNPTTPSGDIDPNKVYVKMDGDYYEVKKGDKVTYNYTISVDGTKKIASLDAYTTYDTKGLKFLPVMDEGEVVATAHFPKITTAVYNFGTAGKIMYNYSSTSGVRMANNSVVFSGEFEVTASKGVYEINSTMITLADTDFNKIVYKSEKVGDYDYDQLLVGLTPVKPSVDPTTPTTPTPTTPVTEKTYVIADGVKYEVAKGQEITYIYYMSYDKKIGSADVNVLYDAEGLEYINMVDEFGDDDLKTMFPVFKDVVYNGSQKGLILYNYSNTSGVRLPVPADGKMTEKNIAFIGKFKVVGGPGTYEINSKIKTLADADLDVLYFDFNKIEGKNVGIETELQVPELPTIPSEPEDDILYGDVDGNGKVNIFDASYVQKSIAGYKGYELDERAFEAADVDFNGKINVFDASRIQKFIAGYFDSFK